jgi:hypothetical protein
MSILKPIYDFFYEIDSLEATSKVVGSFQLLATLSAFMYSFFKDTKPNLAIIFSAIFIFFQLIVLLYFVVIIYISRKYRPIKLRLNRITGVLIDSTTLFRNVTLRDESLNIILEGLENKETSFNVGKNVGENFYKFFDKQLSLTDKEYSTREKLIKWLEYDSSSGMGKFSLNEYSDVLISIKVSSPFMGINCYKNCKRNNKNECIFLLGYIEGFISKLLDESLNSTCEHNCDPPNCNFYLNRYNEHRIL